MVRRSVTRLQVSGYRFLMRRMEYALACRDTRMLDDPIRGQSTALAAGALLAAIVVAVCAVLALLWWWLLGAMISDHLAEPQR